jgi:hypothetical protein
MGVQKQSNITFLDNPDWTVVKIKTQNAVVRTPIIN